MIHVSYEQALLAFVIGYLLARAMNYMVMT